MQSDMTSLFDLEVGRMRRLMKRAKQSKMKKLNELRVLDSLASTSAPGPFSITEQYAKAFTFKPAGKHSDSDGHPDGLVVQPSTTCKKGFRFTPQKVLCNSEAAKSESKPDKPKKASNNKKPKKTGTTKSDHIYGDYIPQNFLERSWIFREEARAQGYSFSEAREMWKNSRERMEMLSMVPLPELKRRRFVSKMVVAELLQVNAPGMLALAILLLTFNDKIPKTKDREFLELFAGKGEACLRGASVDWEYDRQVWNGSFYMGNFNGPTPKRHRQYTKTFGEFLTSLLLKLMKAELPRIITYLNSKHLKPPGLWETWLAEMKTVSC
ncbi:unnamed protein product [Symbiodinium microadriaticum]|nr:unnamed protein product [Symbiodinium sp. KB8]CAE7231381.1 unnamed protein product [Symbiodinium microadriaticum]